MTPSGTTSAPVNANPEGGVTVSREPGPGGPDVNVVGSTVGDCDSLGETVGDSVWVGGGVVWVGGGVLDVGGGDDVVGVSVGVSVGLSVGVSVGVAVGLVHRAPPISAEIKRLPYGGYPAGPTGTAALPVAKSTCQ